MTPDECFDAMAKVLGHSNPQDTGYIQLLEDVKKLKTQMDALRKQTCCADGEKLEDRIGEIIQYKNKYREENKKLKEEVEILNKYREEMAENRRNHRREVEDIVDVKDYIKKLKEETSRSFVSLILSGKTRSNSRKVLF